MQIIPSQIEQSGPGIDMSNLSEGISVKMSDPVKDFKYARNAVTLIYDLSAHVNVHLAFEAMEYGDEPHSPPPNPFGDDVDFDGVAVSADGVAWYEVQDLRHLRSDRFTTYDIDLDAAVAALGLSYGSEFRVRFCQYDNNPAPMDGIFLHGIELTADLRSPVFHLPMDDNAATPTVHDISEGNEDQVFIDPTGDPNTAAHSVPGPNGTMALAFDGVDDQINLGPTLANEALSEGHDFAICWWWKNASETLPGGEKYILSKWASDWATNGFRHMTYHSTSIWVQIIFGAAPKVSMSWSPDALWHHYLFQRRGKTIEIYRDGTLAKTATNDGYGADLAVPRDFLIRGGLGGGVGGAMADLRAYDRAITDEEIVALSE